MTTATTYAADHEKATDHAITARRYRGITQEMSVLGRPVYHDLDDGEYRVVSASGKEYRVNVLGDEPEDRCDCPDARNGCRGADRACKHWYAAVTATGTLPVPEGLEDSICSQHGQHVDSEPVFARDLRAARDLERMAPAIDAEAEAVDARLEIEHEAGLDAARERVLERRGGWA
ncbi:hypothetical protein [Natronosalvus caseinilyticus]|uniref:hypothetical protein n=1 Tax=Natronosalvus caseinilyticus TaxID=2953747 RepID=UPI0028A7D51F|nr:hypothetical protein [Natronosalvus caseinilyticus]